VEGVEGVERVEGVEGVEGVEAVEGTKPVEGDVGSGLPCAMLVGRERRGRGREGKRRSEGGREPLL